MHFSKKTPRHVNDVVDGSLYGARTITVAFRLKISTFTRQRCFENVTSGVVRAHDGVSRSLRMMDRRAHGAHYQRKKSDGSFTDAYGNFRRRPTAGLREHGRERYDARFLYFSPVNPPNGDVYGPVRPAPRTNRAPSRSFSRPKP